MPLMFSGYEATTKVSSQPHQKKIQKRIQIAQVYIAFQVQEPTDYLHVPYKGYVQYRTKKKTTTGTVYEWDAQDKV